MRARGLRARARPTSSKCLLDWSRDSSPSLALAAALCASTCACTSVSSFICDLACVSSLFSVECALSMRPILIDCACEASRSRRCLKTASVPASNSWLSRSLRFSKPAKALASLSSTFIRAAMSAFSWLITALASLLEAAMALLLASVSAASISARLAISAIWESRSSFSSLVWTLSMCCRCCSRISISSRSSASVIFLSVAARRFLYSSSDTFCLRASPRSLAACAPLASVRLMSSVMRLSARRSFHFLCPSLLIFVLSSRFSRIIASL